MSFERRTNYRSHHNNEDKVRLLRRLKSIMKKCTSGRYTSEQTIDRLGQLMTDSSAEFISNYTSSSTETSMFTESTTKYSSPLQCSNIITTGSEIQRQELARSMVDIIDDPQNYIAKMDDFLSPFIAFRIRSNSPETVTKAIDILSRMPQIPKQILPIFHLEEHKYLGVRVTGKCRDSAHHQDTYHDDDQYYDQKFMLDKNSWESLVGDWPINLNTLKISLAIAGSFAAPDIFMAQELQKYIGFLAEMTDSVPSRIHHEGMDMTQLRREAVTMWRSYLSICWQHATVLLFYYALGNILAEGWSDQWSALFSVRLIYDHHWALTFRQPKYMCGQALALLRRSKAAPALDYRNLFSRFEALFKGFPARCDTKYSDYHCDGSIPRLCTRFFGQGDIADQSAHDRLCDRDSCRRILWNSKSYDSVHGGPRAVDVDAMEVSKPSQLLYRRADETSLAISHVWSHGQGGRPETGFNLCLHRRYVSIAKRYNCSSYWIDACCIPTDELRRTEAIKGINSVFGSSRMTLVCDRDLMSVPSGCKDSPENLLATLVVADWNVRGWTLLEGLRGRQNLYVLCAGNELVYLPSLCNDVYESGAMDMIMFLACLQHLLPKASLSYEESGFLLGRRTASRPGDEHIIWGLISRDAVTKSAASILEGVTKVRTGFLVSRMPRLQHLGLTWAPAVAHCGDDFSGSDGNGSECGIRKPEGLFATWLVRHINNTSENRALETMELIYRFEFAIGHALAGLDSAGRRISTPPGEEYKNLALLHAKAESSSDPYIGRETVIFQRLIVLCGSNDGMLWRWLQVLPFNAANSPNLPWETLGPQHFMPQKVMLI